MENKRYMLDTSVLNQLHKFPHNLKIVQDSIHHGYSYYFTDYQYSEIVSLVSPHKNPIKSPMVSRSRVEQLTEILHIMLKLKPTFVAPIANLYHPYTKPSGEISHGMPLDGSYTLSNNEKAHVVFTKILNDNINHYEDAVIASSALIHNCMLVTHDKRMFRKVTQAIENRAIMYLDFIAFLKHGF